MRRAAFSGVLVVFPLLALLASAQTKPSTEGLMKDKYRVVQVEAFDVQPGVELPPNYLAGLPQELAKQLKDSQKFQEVLAPGDKPSLENAPVLRLKGTLTGYDKGSRRNRYFGFGGAASIFLTLRYLDCGTGQLVYQEKVVGTLSGGLFGGEESKVVAELARSVTATTRLVLLRNLGGPNNVVEQPPAEADANPADRQVVEITAGDVTDTEEKMNELASQGYRVSDVRVTTDQSANVAMDKTATPSQPYRYLLLKDFPRPLQENMNKAGSQGYRMVPHSGIALFDYAAIMEKPPAPDGRKFEYRLSASLRQSTAEKHVAEDQQKGFVLVEAVQFQGKYVVVSEKTIPPEVAKR